MTYCDRLSCTSVPCPDRCSSRRVLAGVDVGGPCCSGSDTVLSTAAPERRNKGKQHTTVSCNVESIDSTYVYTKLGDVVFSLV